VTSTALPLPLSRGAEDRGALVGLRAVIAGRHFWSHYEPVVELATGKVVGWEALARFRRPGGEPISPDTVFGLLHAAPRLLLEAELAVKRHQLAHAPAGGLLFLNVDPDSWAAGGEAAAHPLLDLLAGADREVVVEVIENLDAVDALASRGLLAALSARGLKVALDDVGAANSVLSFEALEDAQILKFDRTMLRRLGRPRRHALVKAFAQMARETGARTVLEGVETAADLALARALGVDLVQGWFFKELAVTAGP
jgi:EAL domain-containing protein (putative c-di-GMP-specific phosphodiesterase class I)